MRNSSGSAREFLIL